MKRRRFTAAQRAEVWARQSFRCACNCGARLTEGPVEYDHVIPLSFGGADDLSNIEALMAVCHRTKKTPRDLAMMAKARRQKLHHETGRSSAKQHVKRIPARPFCKQFRKKLDGTVERIDA